jgi:UPF0176 protein
MQFPFLSRPSRVSAQVGHFRDAIEPSMKEFSAFPAFVDAHADAWRGKQVLMYCTGGIRCE